MRTRRRTNLLWGLILLGLVLVLLLRAQQVVPDSLFELMLRAWPVLLVVAGLSILLRARLPFGSGIALLLSVVLVGGIAALGYANRASQQREDYHETIDQSISDDVTLLHIQVQVLMTDLELLPRLDDDRQLGGEFLGSLESLLNVGYEQNGVNGTMNIAEQQSGQLPLLENVGRGSLHLDLPTSIPLDIVLQIAEGNVSLNMSSLAVERMNLDLRSGDALVTLPQYDPLLSGPEDTLGTLAARSGDLTLLVGNDIAVQLELDVGARPIYDPEVYNYLSDLNRLESRNITQAEIVLRYVASAPGGQVIVRSPGES